MPQVLMIAPLAGGSPDVQLLVDEVLTYETGGMLERDINEFVVQATQDLPDGYHTIVDSRALYDDADPLIITGYRLHCLRAEIVNDVSGGWETQSDNPLIDAPPSAVVVRVTGTSAMLNTLDARLRAASMLYGIIPGEVIADA